MKFLILFIVGAILSILIRIILSLMDVEKRKIPKLTIAILLALYTLYLLKIFF
jgi:hypothetical protein